MTHDRLQEPCLPHARYRRNRDHLYTHLRARISRAWPHSTGTTGRFAPPPDINWRWDVHVLRVHVS